MNISGSDIEDDILVSSGKFLLKNLILEVFQVRAKRRCPFLQPSSLLNFASVSGIDRPLIIVVSMYLIFQNVWIWD